MQIIGKKIGKHLANNQPCSFVSVLHRAALPAERGADFSARFCSKAAAAARSAARFRLIRRAALVLSRGRSNRSSAVVAVSVSCKMRDLRDYPSIQLCI